MSIILEENNKKIIREANEILYTLGLHDLLKKFSNPHVSGSYHLKIMTWRDLDIYLVSDTINNDNFFELGKEISHMLEPSKMSFRNEMIGKTPHLPKGLYWGVHTSLFEQQWKIDIWSIDAKEFNEKQYVTEEIKIQLHDTNRNTILELKNLLHDHPKYRKVFFSVDIYDAVLNDHIDCIQSFEKWLYIKRGIDL
ncbi:hypothetical protein LC087_16335 [Bacillus carboniphilus]|uniref:Uncharacterized protein n=1 Tax=Bacillus carboniphilus TaxID=86663 RepID=A0ABY9JVH3_9BACI|nr:hypothetical protein [Bacillus carboniphilus]WLR42273.1 hypothetical protein LC087_16335 [Bacillus carboniphilus]